MQPVDSREHRGPMEGDLGLWQSLVHSTVHKPCSEAASSNYIVETRKPINS